MLTFFLKYFPGDIFENSLFFAASDLIAFGMSGIVLKKTKVTRGLSLAFIIAICGGSIYIMFSTVTAMIPFMICLARVGVTMAYNIGYVSVNRLFPTQFQATVYGIVNLSAHLVACLAPIVAEIQQPYPFIAFLIAILISSFATSMLTEIETQESLLKKH